MMPPNGNAIHFDSRWLGDHGIGRFASEVLKRLPHPVQQGGALQPTHPLDVCYLTSKVLTTSFPVWYSPGYNAPLLGLKRYVFTLHDLNHIDLTANSSFLKRLYYRIVVRRACHRAARILTVSEFSRQRIISWAGVEPGRVVNVGNGVSNDFLPDVPPYQPGYPYLLCIGNRKGHKNEERLLRAFALSDLDSSLRLAFSGPPSDTLRAVAAQLGVTDRIVFLGHIEEKLLPGVYRGAVALLFPSLYEGFGLPVLEAMACATPVLTSNVTALPEVAGDAALVVDPTDVSAISAGIEKLVNDAELRAELVAKGLLRVKLFSWDAVAGRVRAALDEVISS